MTCAGFSAECLCHRGEADLVACRRASEGLSCEGTEWKGVHLIDAILSV